MPTSFGKKISSLLAIIILVFVCIDLNDQLLGTSSILKFYQSAKWGAVAEKAQFDPYNSVMPSCCKEGCALLHTWGGCWFGIELQRSPSSESGTENWVSQSWWARGQGTLWMRWCCGGGPMKAPKLFATVGSLRGLHFETIILIRLLAN